MLHFSGNQIIDFSLSEGHLTACARCGFLSFRICVRFCHKFQTSVYSSLRRVPFNARRHVQKELVLID